LAKQFGASDEAMRGLGDPDRFPFSPEERAAFRFADAMTREGGRVPDEIFEELRRHFDEPQIVEIATVIGTFNYFNRFNNAFDTDITLLDPDVAVRRVERAAAEAADAKALCERVVEILAPGRRYFWVGVFQRIGDRLALLAFRGPAPASSAFRPGEGNVGAAGKTGATRVMDDLSASSPSGACLAAARSALIVPVRSGESIVGVIDVEGDKVGAFDEEDRALVERIAGVLAPALSLS
jgi:putative methionine-R-sulfoxide reductase with GAF domain